VLQNEETQRESCILRGFGCLRIKQRSVNHVFYEGLCASEERNTTWITYFTRVCVPQNKGTQRESRILRGFVCLRAVKPSVIHVSYEGLRASEQWNAAWIMYFTKVCVLQRKETQRESRILRGFVCLWIKERSVNHVFYEGLCASEQWDAAWLTYFTRVCVPQRSETRRESCILRGFVWLRIKKQNVNFVFYEGLCASE
jgi:hypothetical protein